MGFFSGIKNVFQGRGKVGKVETLGPIVPTVRDITDAAGTKIVAGRFNAGLGAFNKYLADQVKRDQAQPERSFQAMVDAQAWANPDKELKAAEKTHYVLGWLYFVFLILDVAVIAWYGSLVAILSGVGCGAYLGASWFKHSFRLWQIRRREFSPVTQFMGDGWYAELFK